MKFVIATQEFNYLINLCLNAVTASGKSTIPILSNILLEAKNGHVILTATDLIVGVRCTAEAKILEEGSTTLPAKKLSQLVRELTSMNLELSTSPSNVTQIVADSSRFKLNGMGRDEYPSLPDLSEAVKMEFKQSVLRDMLYRTSFSVSREDNRYCLTGVSLQVKNGRVICLGTDGKRLSRSFTPINQHTDFTGQYVVPIKAVEEIIKALRDEDESVTLYLMQDKIAVETAQILIVAKLLSGDYPDVDRVIPQATETTVSLHREELSTLLRQISLFATEDTHSVKFTFDSGELKLAANANDVGEGKVSMPVNYHGPRLEIAFNSLFFLDILRHSKNETVSIGLTDSYNPGVIVDDEYDVISTQESSPLFVLMPMRLSEV